jgi:predicted RNase H-like nuclease (RuvC/YqgF family)
MELKSEKREQIMAINNEKGAEKFDEKQAQEQFQEEVAKLEAQLEEVFLEVDTSETNALTLKSKIEEYSRKLEEITRQNEELKKEAEQKHRLALLLSDQALSLSKLEKELEDNESKLASMKTEWENYKAPLLEEIQQKEKFLEKQKKKYKDELEEIKLMREEMKEMVQEAELKDEMYDLLLDEESRTASNINRNVYIKTITDVINKLKQQKRGISKILKDVTEVQKSISMFRDTLQRVDAETENMMFESASKAKKKDVLPRAIYKLLVDLREQYTLLVRTVEDQLKIKNSIQDLEIRVESVRSRTANKDIEKLKEDLEKIRQERVS